MAGSVRPEAQFFIFDHTFLQKEEDDLKDAIIYFYPATVNDDQQCALCGQLMGMVEYFRRSFASPPSMYKLGKCKVAVKHVGQYSLAYTGSLNFPDKLLTRQLEKLYTVFSFYLGSLDIVFQMSDCNRKTFVSRMPDIWESFVSFTTCYGQTTAEIFANIPVLELPKKSGTVFIMSAKLLSNCQRVPGILAGCLLHKQRVLCTQFSHEITTRLLLIRAQQSHLPCQPVETSFDLPRGIRVLKVFVSYPEYLVLQASSYDSDNKHYKTSQFRPGKNKPTGTSSTVSFSNITKQLSDSSLSETSCSTPNAGLNNTYSESESDIGIGSGYMPQLLTASFSQGASKHELRDSTETDNNGTDKKSFRDSVGADLSFGNEDSAAQAPQERVTSAIISKDQDIVNSVTDQGTESCADQSLSSEIESEKLKTDQSLSPTGESSVIETEHNDVEGVNESKNNSEGITFSNEPSHTSQDTHDESGRRENVCNDDGTTEKLSIPEEKNSVDNGNQLNVLLTDPINLGVRLKNVDNSIHSLVEPLGTIIPTQNTAQNELSTDSLVGDRLQLVAENEIPWVTRDSRSNLSSETAIKNATSTCDTDEKNLSSDGAQSNDVGFTDGEGNTVSEHSKMNSVSGESFSFLKNEANCSDISMVEPCATWKDAPVAPESSAHTTGDSGIVYCSPSADNDDKLRLETGNSNLTPACNADGDLDVSSIDGNKRVEDLANSKQKLQTSGPELSDKIASDYENKTPVGEEVIVSANEKKIHVSEQAFEVSAPNTQNVGRKLLTPNGGSSDSKLFSSQSSNASSTQTLVSELVAVTNRNAKLTLTEKENAKRIQKDQSFHRNKDTSHSSSGTSVEVNNGSNGETVKADNKINKKEYNVPGMKPLSLYIQGNSDMVLLLLMEQDSATANTIRSLWQTSIQELADLDFQLRELTKSGSRSSADFTSFKYLTYDNYQKSLSGNALDPVSNLENEFCNMTRHIHNDFNQIPLLRDMTLRSHTNCASGHREITQETFVQMESHVPSSKTDLTIYDLNMSLDSKTKSSLIKKHRRNIIL